MKSASSRSDMTARKPISRSKQNLEPVKVFCRLKPLLRKADRACMKIVADSMLIIEPPESAANYRSNHKIIQTTFSRVLGPDISQIDVFNVVARPLIVDLINGKNGLLFTYGVTGSGKTYTMCGIDGEAGIMPRCLDILFNSIANHQAKKHVFKPDNLNGFDVQYDVDAIMEGHEEIHRELMMHHGDKPNLKQVVETMGINSECAIHIEEIPDITVDPDSIYAVFVSYIEVYNNSVYDLLEEDDSKLKPLQSKIIREDSNKNMYVHGGTEVEVKNSEEAFKIFQRGQRKRRIAYTSLNAESSRSHSIFTIRLVQAPLDDQGEHVICDKRVVCVSQLSLVDLAGSERSNRSKNTGQRLREAGNINNSLMTLRTCMEILRENQTQGTNKLVPYRDSKLTHLFKHYFDGDGKVHMIVCVNPSVDDYDETIQVMKFAELSQDVQIANPMPSKFDLGLTPGRRQANKLFKEARNRLENAGLPHAATLEVDLGLVYSLGGPFPISDISNPHNDEIITALMRFLEQRIQKRNALRDDLRQKQHDLRNMLVKVERDNVSLKIENASLKAVDQQNRKQISALEAHVSKVESQVDTLLFRLNKANDVIRHLQQDVQNKDITLQQRAIEKQRVKSKYNNKMQMETDKMSKELETKLRQQRELLQNQMKEQDQKLKLVKQILTDDQQTPNNATELPKQLKVTDKVAPVKSVASCIETPIAVSPSDGVTSSAKTSSTNNVQTLENVLSPLKNLVERIPVVNPRYRRSRSADRWIDHRPPGLVPVGTILQPLMHRKRSVKQLVDPKDFTERASRYCLVAQEQDTDGELETRLYKGDILPTSGGGAQVIFNDLENLKQVSPVPRKKRVSYFSPEIKSRTSVTNCVALQEEQSKKPRI